MCQRVDCPKCGRPTYAGCGKHVEQVLGNVPEAARCKCRDSESKATGGAAAPAGRSWLRTLLGK
jgi:hypothetical protein